MSYPPNLVGGGGSQGAAKPSENRSAAEARSDPLRPHTAMTHHPLDPGDRPDMEQLLYTPEQAADVLAVGRTTVYGLMTDGALRSVKIGRARRITAQALHRYVAELTRGAD